MQAVLDAPVLAGQCEQARGIGLVGTQAGDQPDGLGFLPTTLEDADAL
jgi:hypothetical protein